MAPRNTGRLATSTDKLDEAGCKVAGGTWNGKDCVGGFKVTMKVFKGNPCNGRFITRTVKVSNPAHIRTLASVVLKNR